MGELRKTYSHSPLEILPELYTANSQEGQPGIQENSRFFNLGSKRNLTYLDKQMIFLY